MEASRLLTSEEAAEYLRLDTKTVYRLIDEDRLKAALIGRVYRIDMKDVREFLRQSKSKVQSASKKGRRRGGGRGTV
jgi:excisionase family DNA binding protein